MEGNSKCGEEIWNPAEYNSVSIKISDSLINLHEKDKILLARETALLKESEKRNRQKKVRVFSKS